MEAQSNPQLVPCRAEEVGASEAAVALEAVVAGAARVAGHQARLQVPWMVS